MRLLTTTIVFVLIFWNKSYALGLQFDIQAGISGQLPGFAELPSLQDESYWDQNSFKPDFFLRSFGKLSILGNLGVGVGVGYVHGSNNLYRIAYKNSGSQEGLVTTFLSTVTPVAVPSFPYINATLQGQSLVLYPLCLSFYVLDIYCGVAINNYTMNIASEDFSSSSIKIDNQGSDLKARQYSTQIGFTLKKSWSILDTVFIKVFAGYELSNLFSSDIKYKGEVPNNLKSHLINKDELCCLKNAVKLRHRILFGIGAGVSL